MSSLHTGPPGTHRNRNGILLRTQDISPYNMVPEHCRNPLMIPSRRLAQKVSHFYWHISSDVRLLVPCGERKKGLHPSHTTANLSSHVHCLDTLAVVFPDLWSCSLTGNQSSLFLASVEVVRGNIDAGSPGLRTRPHPLWNPASSATQAFKHPVLPGTLLWPTNTVRPWRKYSERTSLMVQGEGLDSVWFKGALGKKELVS